MLERKDILQELLGRNLFIDNETKKKILDNLDSLTEEKLGSLIFLITKINEKEIYLIRKALVNNKNLFSELKKYTYNEVRDTFKSESKMLRDELSDNIAI